MLQVAHRFLNQKHHGRSTMTILEKNDDYLKPCFIDLPDMSERKCNDRTSAIDKTCQMHLKDDDDDDDVDVANVADE